MSLAAPNGFRHPDVFDQRVAPIMHVVVPNSLWAFHDECTEMPSSIVDMVQCHNVKSMLP